MCHTLQSISILWSKHVAGRLAACPNEVYKDYVHESSMPTLCKGSCLATASRLRPAVNLSDVHLLAARNESFLASELQKWRGSRAPVLEVVLNRSRQHQCPCTSLSL